MKARAFVDPSDVIGQVSPLIYGHFIEHLGCCIYGGIWVGEDSPLPNVRGFRRDVLEAVQAISPPLVRYPGGNFASAYHFEDGIGPRAQRPSRWDLAWKTVEPNHVGTDEFIEWCRLVKAQPYLCVNAGNGTPEEAARWVEYCNGTQSTHHANLRRANGHAEAYGVKYWSVGNELYGDWQIGHCSDGKECAQRTRAFAQAMKSADPAIELVGVGTRHDQQWNWDVLTGAGRWLQQLSVHCYVHLHQHSLSDLLGASEYVAQILDTVAATIKGARAAARIEHPITIALDEWNLWYHDIPADHDPGSNLAQVTALKDALFTAAVFNVFHRHCQVLSMANVALTVNCLPLIHTRPDGGFFCNPQYLAFQLYVHHTGNVCVRSRVDVDAYRTEAASFYGEVCKADVPFLDLSVTCTPATKTLFLHAVNRHATESIECEFDLREASPTTGTAYVLTADSADARNSFDTPHAVQLAQRLLAKVGGKFAYGFPPLSVTVLELR